MGHLGGLRRRMDLSGSMEPDYEAVVTMARRTGMKFESSKPSTPSKTQRCAYNVRTDVIEAA